MGVWEGEASLTVVEREDEVFLGAVAWGTYFSDSYTGRRKHISDGYEKENFIL